MFLLVRRLQVCVIHNKYFLRYIATAVTFYCGVEEAHNIYLTVLLPAPHRLFAYLCVSNKLNKHAHTSVTRTH